MARDNIKSYQPKFLSEETEKMLNSGHCYYCGCETQRRGILRYTHVIWGKGIVTGKQKLADHNTFEVPILECPNCARVKHIQGVIAFSYLALLIGYLY